MPPDPIRTETETPQEMDAWWGSYSGRALIPIFCVAVVLAALIDIVCSQVLSRGVARLTIVGTAILILGLQILRWLYLIVGYNYRLTTRRLLRERGIFYRDIVNLPLAQIARVEVKQGAMERMLGLGRIVIHAREMDEPVILDAVYNPSHVALLIQEHVRDYDRNIGTEARLPSSNAP